MKLVLAEFIIESQLINYFEEWKCHKEEIIPTSTDLTGLSFYEWKCNICNSPIKDKNKFKNDSDDLFFLLNESNIIIGAVNIKYKLSPYLRKNGGNIGYGIRYSERNKGFGRYILQEAIKIWFNTNNKSIQIACFYNNIGSKKIIESCGAELIRQENTKNGVKSIYLIPGQLTIAST